MALRPNKLLILFFAVLSLLSSQSAVAADTDGLTAITNSSNTLFILIGAVMILAMHSGFAFLEVGSVRRKNQVNALNKIIAEWGFSTLIYFFIGYPISRGINFLVPISDMSANNGLDYVRFFLFLGFAACIPAIISGGVAERSKFWTNSIAGGIFVGLVYPFIEGATWGEFSTTLGGTEGWLATTFGAPFHDFAGSVVVHATGGWLALPAVILLGPRIRVAETDTIEVSSIPFLALGSWILIVGWFGFNVMSAGAINNISGLVAINSLLAMVGGTIAALIVSKNDAGFVHNGALAGLVAVCAGSDLYHPVGALVVGAVAGLIFVFMFQVESSKLKWDDVLGVWPLHGLCGIWGGIAAGIFGMEALGGAGGVSFMSQIIVSLGVIAVSLVASFGVYGLLKKTVGIRLHAQQERIGSDISIHAIASSPEEMF
ncbi:MAG: ammonium transporter [Deltaproteobacteria bacterium]|nr:ammonium transporter [Deltaproteobacteria bacterium]